MYKNYLLVCRASAIFVGVYEPAKKKLLKIFPENLSALAHFVREIYLLLYVICISSGTLTNERSAKSSLLITLCMKARYIIKIVALSLRMHGALYH